MAQFGLNFETIMKVLNELKEYTTLSKDLKNDIIKNIKVTEEHLKSICPIPEEIDKWLNGPMIITTDSNEVIPENNKSKSDSEQDAIVFEEIKIIEKYDAKDSGEIHFEEVCSENTNNPKEVTKEDNNIIKEATSKEEFVKNQDRKSVV